MACSFIYTVKKDIIEIIQMDHLNIYSSEIRRGIIEKKIQTKTP